MKLLIIGGTKFLGRHLAAAALARGHQLTLFHRGRTNPDLFPAAKRLIGDRDGGLEALAGRRWDAVIDTCGYLPRVVAASSRRLAEQAGHYTFISSISVYADFTAPNLDESAPVATLADPATEGITGETYGALKALCEEAATAAMPGRTLIIRPGLIVGPHDPTDRYTYWPERVARGGEVLAPAPADRPVQYIDGRDLAEWTVRMVEVRRTGVYNATGPDQPHTMADLLTACQEAAGVNPSVTWVTEDFLLAQQVGPWMELPLWIPGSTGGLHTVNISRALADGLTFRPPAETAADTLAWSAAARPGDAPRNAGLAAEREAALLRAWQAAADG